MATTIIPPSITFDRRELSDEQLRQLYRHLVKPRLIEQKMLLLLRQGQVSKWFSGVGQEAISVGAAAALQSDEIIFTMHRNLGVFTTRNVPLYRLFCQWQGKADGFTKGRDRSFHFGTLAHHIVGMISHLGPQLSLADGVALAHKLSGEQKVTLAFTGEGGTSEGEFHEALNVASVWQLPVIFLIENNGYGLSTPVSEQYRCTNLADRAIGYGMPARIIDGNNILEVYHTIKGIAHEMRQNPQPWLIEARTFRMRGHEEASGTKYVPQTLFDEWSKRDPIDNYRAFLLSEGVFSEEEIAQIEAHIKEEINEAWEQARQAPPIQSTEEQELADVYVPETPVSTPPQGATQKMRFVDAISDGLRIAMERHPNLILMGQDIAEYGGVFKVTQGFIDLFGKERVRNTPLCESAIVGAALGLSFKGYKSMVEMQFADFVTCAFNQIVNNLAKIHYRWGAIADVVVRMPTGAGVGAGPFHSQSNEAWFAHTPGLKVVYPATPEDAKGLLLMAFEDPNPVMFFEHKALYRSISSQVPEGHYTLPFGQARVARPGTEASIITYGMGVHWAMQVVEAIGADIEVIDLRTLIPLDTKTIFESVRKTNKVLVLHEDTLTAGFGAEIAARITEACFNWLDAPVMRLASLDAPVPFAPQLEQLFLPKNRLQKKLEQLLQW